MDFAEYELAIRTSLKVPTVILRRTCAEIMINAYNRPILLAWRGNIDIQLMLDPYAAMAYITATYTLKSTGILSRVLQIASHEIAKGNEHIRVKLNSLGAKFQNCSEVSAQECVYNLAGTARDEFLALKRVHQHVSHRRALLAIKDRRVLDDDHHSTISLWARFRRSNKINLNFFENWYSFYIF